MECASGTLSNKWRIFQRPLNVGPDFAVIIVKPLLVGTVLFFEKDCYKLEDALTGTGLEDVPEGQWGVSGEQCRE